MADGVLIGNARDNWRTNAMHGFYAEQYAKEHVGEQMRAAAAERRAHPHRSRRAIDWASRRAIAIPRFVIAMFRPALARQ